VNKSQRTRYHAELWPAVCSSQGWDPRDEARRHSVTEYATGQESTKDLTQAQITALFVFLDHLADPSDAGKAHQWETCKADPDKFNRLRQAEYWRRRARYTTTGKLNHDRFGVVFNEQLDASLLDDHQVDQMLMTNRQRAQAHQRRQKPERAPNRIEDKQLCPF
jgi:hypothetical protein